MIDFILIFGGCWWVLSVAAGIALGRAIRRGETTAKDVFGL